MITNGEFMTYYKDMCEVAGDFEGVGTKHYQESLWQNRVKIAEVREFIDNLAPEIYWLTGVGSVSGEIHPDLII